MDENIRFLVQRMDECFDRMHDRITELESAMRSEIKEIDSAIKALEDFKNRVVGMATVAGVIAGGASSLIIQYILKKI